MPKKLSTEEKQLREYKKDVELSAVLLCSQCKKKHYIAIKPVFYSCKCKNILIDNSKINEKKCKIIYERK